MLARLSAAVSCTVDAKVAPSWQSVSARSGGELAIKLRTQEVQLDLCGTRGNRYCEGKLEVLNGNLPSNCMRRVPLIYSEDGELRMSCRHKHHPTPWTPPC